jgi:hypothetical protein
VLTWDPSPRQIDLIVTNFFFDCFREDELSRIIPRLASAASHASNWLVADFQIAPRGWRKIRSRVIVGLLYRFFRATTRLSANRLTPPDPYLAQCGFRLQQRVEQDHGLLQSDWWTRP